MNKRMQDRLGFALIAGVVVCISGFLLYMVLNHKQKPREDLCEQGRPIRKHHIFVIDQSDPVPARNIEQLRRIFEKTLRELEKNDRVSIYGMTDSASAYSKDNRSICNPGRGEEANQLTENPQRIEASFKNNFVLPLERSLASEAMTRKSAQSPILEFLLDVTRVQSLLPPANEKTYYIVSDFIQHSPLLNQYKEWPAFQEFERHDAMVFHTPDFRGSEINLIYVERPEFRGIQSTAHKRFWRDYFLHFRAGRVNLL